MISKNLLILLIIALIGIGCEQADSFEDSTKNQRLNANAPTETESLGRLVGKWDAKIESLDKDGNWNPGTNNIEWHWYYILNGHGIQDDWITEKLAADGSDSTLVYGTNIRIFNKQENKWYMAWIHGDGRKLASFTAVNEDDNVIMEGKNANGREVRITFFDITENSFEWQQEWTFDEGKSWTVVVKIHCTRLNSGALTS